MYTARILVGFMQIGFKVCAARRQGVWRSHARGR